MGFGNRRTRRAIVFIVTGLAVFAGWGPQTVQLTAAAAASKGGSAKPGKGGSSTTTSTTSTSTSTTSTSTTSTSTTSTTSTSTTSTTTTLPALNPYAGHVGLSSKLVWSDEATEQSQLSTIAAGGVTWIREDFLWAALEPQAGTWNWTDTDNLMTAAASTGVHVLAILGYSAPWASSDPTGGGSQYYPPRNDSDYASFAGAVVARYGPGGTFWAEHLSLQPDPVTAVELWNEAYGYWDWLPNPDPAAYDRLVRAAVSSIRAVVPSEKILASGTLNDVHSDGTSVGWISTLLADDPGLGSVIDAWAIHPYPDPNNLGPYDTSEDVQWEYGRVATIRQAELNAGVSLPLWITEVGWSTAPGASSAVDETTQAQYTHDAIYRARNDWAGYVPMIFIYDWERSTGTTGDVEGNYGLMRSDGSLKPAWSSIVGLIKNGT